MHDNHDALYEIWRGDEFIDIVDFHEMQRLAELGGFCIFYAEGYGP